MKHPCSNNPQVKDAGDEEEEGAHLHMNKKPVGTMMMNNGHGCKPKFKG